MMTKHFVATTSNGKKIYVDDQDSHAATHLVDEPGLFELIQEMLAQVKAIGDNLYIDRDMGRIVGTSALVATTEEDDILYAKRPNRAIYTRFVRNREPIPTRYVTVVLHKDSEATYNLHSAWIGRAVPQFPGDSHETPESKPFWANHALIWGSQTIQPGSETRVQPWS